MSFSVRLVAARFLCSRSTSGYQGSTHAGIVLTLLALASTLPAEPQVPEVQSVEVQSVEVQSVEVQSFGVQSVEAQRWELPGAETQDSEFLGTEFQINSYSTGGQKEPVIAAVEGGSFFAVFTSGGSAGGDTDQSSIQAQRLASDGSMVGAQFQVNAYTSSNQELPAVAARPGGGFVAVWQSRDSPGSDSLGRSVIGRLFDSTGSPETADFQVNSLTVDDQDLAAVAAGSSGDFVVVWESSDPGADGDFTAIQGQRFASDGTFIGAEFAVNAGTLADQRQPSLGIDESGGFVVVWNGIRDLGGDTIWGRRFDSGGSAIGGDFEIALPGGTSYGTQPDIWVEAEGSFVVVWIDYGMSTGDNGIVKGRRYDSAGVAVDEPYDISPVTTAIKSRPAIARDSDGGFLVTWQSSFDSTGDDNDFASLHGRYLGLAGEPLGESFQINTVTTGAQFFPDVAAGPGGRALVVWDSELIPGSPFDDRNVKGQRLLIETPIFADGFESGDISAWGDSR